MAYYKNNLGRNVLITVEEVLFHAPTKHTLDPRMIESSIIIAEERFIMPELGSKWYEDLINNKNIEITAGNLAFYQPLYGAGKPLAEGDILNSIDLGTFTADNKALWKRHLWKLVAECVLVSAYPEGFVQFGNEGTFHNSPPAGLMVTSGQVTPLLTSMKWSIDTKVKDRIGPLINSMHLYICQNVAKYTLYTKVCPEECADPDLKNIKNVGIALDIYDDDERTRCCGGTGHPPG